MKREHIASLGDADIYFVERGAVGYFDSLFPKERYEDIAKIFKRHYFKEGEQHMGYYIPAFENAGPMQALKHTTDQRDHWTNHPNLVKLMARIS